MYKPSSHNKSPITEPCAPSRSIKRPLCVGANIEQRPWKPTARKAAINNEFLPGKPAYQMLPPYMGPNVIDSRKKSAPAYSLGRKSVQKPNNIGVGPAKVNVRGLCNRGLRTAPAFSLKCREQGVTKFLSPSPTKYSTQKSFKAITKAIPQFSFGKRPIVFKTLPTPGKQDKQKLNCPYLKLNKTLLTAPNVYNLPPVFGTAKEGQIKSAPAFTMLGRANPQKDPALRYPGPADHKPNYRYQQKLSPRYTLHIKHKAVTDEHMKSGPASHCPENV